MPSVVAAPAPKLPKPSKLSRATSIRVEWTNPSGLNKDRHELSFSGLPGQLAPDQWKAGRKAHNGHLFSDYENRRWISAHIFTSDETFAIRNLLRKLEPVLSTPPNGTNTSKAGTKSIVVSAFPINGKPATWKLSRGSAATEAILHGARYLEDSLRRETHIYPGR
jgi:hypothetical protein